MIQAPLVDDAATRRRSSAARYESPLPLAGLVALTFFSVTGGPFGQELLVKAGGPLVALGSFALMTLLWSVPEALMTAELSSAFPEAAGFAAWCNAAYGPLVAWVDAWCSWVSGVVDNAVYPVLVLEYASRATDAFDDPLPRALFVAGFVAGLTYLCHRGLDLTGRSAVALTAFVLAPFGVLVVVAIPTLRPARWLARPASWRDVRLRSLVNTLFWNVNYYDSASAWAGDARRETWGVAMASSVALCASSSLLPMLAATGGSSLDRRDYRNGSYVTIATDLAGPWLGLWIVLSAAAANVGMFVSEMSSDAYQLTGMAERGLLPAALAAKSERTGTPTLAILLSAGGVLALSRLSFEAIVATENLLYVVSMVIELSAFYRLRRTRKDLDRRYVAPLSDGALLATLAPAVLCLALVAAVQPLEVWLLSAGLLLAGLALYGAIGATRRGNRLCAYHVLHADWAAPPGGLAARLGWADRLDDDPAALPEYDAAPPELSTGDEAASPLTS
jgi:amino acid transporter